MNKNFNGKHFSFFSLKFSFRFTLQHMLSHKNVPLLLGWKPRGLIFETKEICHFRIHDFLIFFFNEISEDKNPKTNKVCRRKVLCGLLRWFEFYFLVEILLHTKPSQILKIRKIFVIKKLMKILLRRSRCRKSEMIIKCCLDITLFKKMFRIFFFNVTSFNFTNVARCCLS